MAGETIKLTHQAPAYPAENGAELQATIIATLDALDEGADELGTWGKLLDSETILHSEDIFFFLEGDGRFAEFSGKWRAVRGVPGNAVQRYWVPEKFCEVQVQLPETVITGKAPAPASKSAGVILLLLLGAAALLG